MSRDRILSANGIAMHATLQNDSMDAVRLEHGRNGKADHSRWILVDCKDFVIVESLPSKLKPCANPDAAA